jgi:hypothetical protein
MSCIISNFEYDFRDAQHRPCTLLCLLLLPVVTAAPHATFSIRTVAAYTRESRYKDIPSLPDDHSKHISRLSIPSCLEPPVDTENIDD